MSPKVCVSTSTHGPHIELTQQAYHTSVGVEVGDRKEHGLWGRSVLISNERFRDGFTLTKDGLILVEM